MQKHLEEYFRPGTEEHSLLLKVDLRNLPRHVAVIMDGNGRWAEQRGLSRVEGHKAGAASVREAVEAAARLGLEFLTLYAFSRENWKRPRQEVGRLWRLLREYLGREDSLLVENDIRLLVIGRREGIPWPVLREIERVENVTRENGRMTLVVALNYGGRDEIVEAARRIMAEGIAGDDFSGPIGSALLEVITICNEIIIMACAAGHFGAVRDFAFQGKRASIESPQNDLLMWRCLRGNRAWENKKKRETYKNEKDQRTYD